MLSENSSIQSSQPHALRRIEDQEFVEYSTGHRYHEGHGRLQAQIQLGDQVYPGQTIMKIVDTLEKNVPGVKKVVIPGAGHMVNIEKPAEFNKAVLEFLGRN